MSMVLVRQSPEAVTRTIELLKLSSQLPKHYRENLADLELACWDMNRLDIPVSSMTINLTYVIDKKVEFMAQLQIALAMRAGYVLVIDDDATNSTQAVVYVRTVNEPSRLPNGQISGARVSFTWEDALRSQKVHYYEKRVDTGRKYPPKNTDPIYKVMRWVPGLPTGSPGADKPAWVTDDLELIVANERYLTHPRDMLTARVCTRAIKNHCPGVKLGIAAPVFLPTDSSLWEGPAMVDAASVPVAAIDKATPTLDIPTYFAAVDDLAAQLGKVPIELSERLVKLATSDRTDDPAEIRPDELPLLKHTFKLIASGSLNPFPAIDVDGPILSEEVA